MPEIWDIYDERRVKKPYTHVRGEALQEGDFHLVAEIWTFTKDDKLLLTLRHPDKHFGGTWECTGGSALAGEDSLKAAQRELREETGLEMSKTIPTLLTTVTDHAKHTIYDIYAVRLDFTLGDVVLQEGETVNKQLVDLSFIEDPANGELLCPPQMERANGFALPFLRRFAAHAECWDMYDHQLRPLGYNRLRPISEAEQQHPWETSLSSIALIQHTDGRVLLTQRAPHKAAGLQWGCTGGGIATGETPEIALQREVQEEIGLDISAIAPVRLSHAILDGIHGKFTLVIYHIRLSFALEELVFQPEEVVDAKLVWPEELQNYPLVEGILRRDASILEQLMQP